MAGPLDEPIRIAKVVEENIQAEKNVKPFKMAPIPPIVQVPDLLDFPNYSGIKKEALKTDPTTLGGAVSSVFTRTGAVVAVTNDYTWAQIDKTTSSIADITTKSHTALSDIGTNTHAQIDTHIADSSDPHGATLTQTNIDGTTISGSSIRTTEDHTISGSARVVGIITHTSPTPPTASNYAQGTLYIQYTA